MSYFIRSFFLAKNRRNRMKIVVELNAMKGGGSLGVSS